jgi:HEAT repeat protein
MGMGKRGCLMWRRLIMMLLPVVVTALCVLLWIDSRFVVRRLPLIPLGDAELGFKSKDGWLSWNMFWLWNEAHPEAAAISAPYWVIISVALAFARRAVVLRRRDTRVRWWEWTALGAIALSLAFLQGRTDPIEDLLRAIRNPHDRYATHEVFEAVDEVNHAERGNDAVVPLARLLEDNTSSIRVRAVRALGKLHAGPNLVVSALTKAHADKELRYFVTVTLGEIGPIDPRIVPALIVSLRDEGPRIRGAAASALLELGPAAESAVPALVEALDDKALRREVLLALTKIGPNAKSAVPALIKLLKTSTDYDRLQAAQALWKIDQDIDVVVPALVESLKDPFLPIRCDAADVLGEIGPRARAAVPALIAARDYKPKPHPQPEARKAGEANLPIVEEMPEEEFYPRVRDAASRALSRIKGNEEKGRGF